MSQFQMSPVDSQIEDTIDDVPAAERRAASLLVCSHATDVDDARTMLAMLGLLPGQPDLLPNRGRINPNPKPDQEDK